jgi:sortase A
MQTPNDPSAPPPPSAPSSKTSAFWSWLERALIIVGIICLGYYAYVSIETHLYQRLEDRELEALLSTAPPEPVPAPRTPPGPSPKVKRPRNGSMVGRIEIPRLGVSAIIRAGSDAKTLRLAVGHIPGTALPGQVGNIGLAGHRDTFFRRLRDIRAADVIRVVTPTGTFAFKVDTTQVVNPKDTWVLNHTATPTLTLVTCYPFTYVGSAPKRFIVHAVASNTIASRAP